jgi:hypothetical protein
MAYINLTKAQRAEVDADLSKLAAIQKRMDEGAGDYYNIIKQIREVQKDIDKITTATLNQQNKASAAAADLTTAQTNFLNNASVANAAAVVAAQNRYDIEEAIVEKLKEQKAELDLINKQLVVMAKNSNMVTGILKTGWKDLVATKQALGKVYDKLQIADIFKMSKSIKLSALNMGVLSSQADSFSKDIQAAALETIEFGVGIEDIAKIQSTYSEELGRTVMLGTKGAIALGEMATTTGLGAEGAASMAASLDMVGLSAERTANYVEQVMNDSHAMGLNSSKVIKNIQSNIKLLNRYNFKNGVKGLAAMAESTTKMGVSMEMVAPMAEKLFDIEGAVEMSAQLQVLGGKWSELADPFKLMHMARTNMTGLADAVIEATTATASFNKETQIFEVAPMEMQRLRKVAEATGLDFEQLSQTAKKVAQYSQIKKQVSFDIDPSTEKYIEAVATFDENGKAQIIVDGSNKYLDALSANDKAALVKIAAEKEDMKTRAKESVTLDEMLGNTITMLKQMAIPFVDALNTNLKPMVDNFVKAIKDPVFQDRIKGIMDGIANFVIGTAKFITEFPLATAGLFLIFEAAKWIGAGMMVGLGFNRTASMGGMGALKGIGKGVMAGGLGGVMGYSVGTLASKAAGQKSTGEGDVASIAGTIVGGIVGSLGGPVGTMIGAGIGSSIGKFFGDKFYQPEGDSLDDGIINFNPNDKFMKVNNDTMIAGTNVNGNKDLANALKSINFGEKDKPTKISYNTPISGSSVNGDKDLASALKSINFDQKDKPTKVSYNTPISGSSVNGNRDLASALKSINFDQKDKSTKDKSMKVNDGIITGTNVNGNKDLANALNASVPQLPNKAALMNSIQDGNVASTTSANIPSSITINFGELKFGGSIELTNGQNTTSDMGKQLINTPSFVRDMSKMVHQQTNSAVQGMIKTALQK